VDLRWRCGRTVYYELFDFGRNVKFGKDWGLAAKEALTWMEEEFAKHAAMREWPITNLRKAIQTAEKETN
jgi:hypothetical protein